MKLSSISYNCHRFPPHIIAHAVSLYVRFNLSFREVEEMLLQRGIDASYETVRRWVIKFGPAVTRNLRQRQNLWSQVLALARGRSARRRAGRNPPAQTGQTGGKTAVAPPDKTSWFHSQADHHGQTAFVWRYQARGRAGIVSLVAQGFEQSSREQPSPFPKPGTDDARPSLPRRFTEVHSHPFSHSELLLCPRSPPLRLNNPISPPQGI